MTDARHPERWLNDRRFLRLSDAAYRLYGTALLWAVSNRTDGVIAEADLRLIPAVDPALAEELAKQELWRRHRDGWVIVDWASTQTTRKDLESLENVRRWQRETKARQREKKAREEAEAEGVHVDSPGGLTTWTTQDRKGEERQGDEVESNHDVPRAEPNEDWPAVASPGSVDARSWSDDLYDRE